MAATLFLQWHGQPHTQGRLTWRTLYPHPVQQLIHVVNDGLFARRDRLTLGYARAYPGGQVGLDFEEKVPAFMNKCREVGLFKHADDAGLLGNIVGEGDLSTVLLKQGLGDKILALLSSRFHGHGVD